MSKRNGYTITEMIVVMAVMIATASAATIMGHDMINSGKYSTAKSGASALALAVSHYKLEIGTYPATLSDLTSKKNNKGPWIESDALKDPWNNNYNYSYNTSTGKFAIWSNGANKTSQSSINAIGGDDAGTTSH